MEYTPENFNKLKAAVNDLTKTIQDLLILSTPAHFNDEQQAKRLHIPVSTLIATKQALHNALNMDGAALQAAEGKQK